MSVINDVQTNRVFALSAHSYFCLNTAQYIHVVEYSECFITRISSDGQYTVYIPVVINYIQINKSLLSLNV